MISRWRDEMDDGLLVPGLHDGMAAFPGPEGLTILMRNHEVLAEYPERRGAFDEGYARLSRIDAARLYDGGHGRPLNGGVTGVVYDTKNQRLVRHYLALGGTAYNCAGGPTPWNTWLTCEEWHGNLSERCEKLHGYVFEVPASALPVLHSAKPLPALGRFRHEAVAVDARSGILYLTEDIEDGLFYRFIPNVPGNLSGGGRLQALAVMDKPSCDLRNWTRGGVPEAGETIAVGTKLSAHWIELSEVDTPADDLRYRGFASGAARFARAEGIWHDHGTIYFACTTGGSATLGQIWMYRPEPGASGLDETGRLELFIEPTHGRLIANADNLTVGPNGDLFVCEDSEGRDRVVRVTPKGETIPFAANRMNDDEFCGACFSPDGSTFFVNVQGLGVTLAITGPWPWMAG